MGGEDVSGHVTQWEYCQLIADGRRDADGKAYYDVDLHFLGPQGRSRRIAERDGPAANAWSSNPWKQCIGLLGLGGWEMVSIQHGDYAGRLDGSTIAWNTVVAYFRRPVEPGRPIDDPRITLSP